MMCLLKNLFVICFFILCGCSAPKPPAPSINIEKANGTFTQLCKDEFKYDLKTFVSGKTLWIYYPLQEDILETKASREITDLDKEVKIKPAVNLLEGEFKDGIFTFEYDISESRNYKKSVGYASNYTEEYQKIQSNVLQAIQRAYFDLETPPQFIVLVVADTVNGLEMESIFYFEDLKRTMGMIASISQEEFMKRYVYELRGSLKIVDDSSGEHLKIKDIALPEFLTKQIINRINFKFQRSSFEPTKDYQLEILAIIAETLNNYSFENFSAIELYNLLENNKYSVAKDDLPSYADGHSKLSGEKFTPSRKGTGFKRIPFKLFQP